MLRRVDRIVLRVPGLPAAVAYYRDVLKMPLLRQESRLAVFKLADDGAELILHVDPDLPGEATYYLVDDVRALYEKRAELKLTFVSPPKQAARGYRATVRDPFGVVLLILDRTTEKQAGQTVVEDAKAPGTLFAGVEPETKSRGKPELLIKVYEQIGRTADDLPYTPHFETLYKSYTQQFDPAPTRQEVWRQLLNLRKAGGKLPKLGEARSIPPEISPEDRAKLREMLGADIGKRDRLPYTKRFDELVDQFNQTQPRPLSPHLVWRLVATLAK
jgi:catechol 2,3-dioxygenase-like lactoylglutathione lyase family enzyme